MPLLEIAASQSDGSRHDFVIALLNLQSVMLFPSDDAKREAFKVSLIANSFLQGLKGGAQYGDDGGALPPRADSVLKVLKDGAQSGDDGGALLPRGLVRWALNHAPNFSALCDEAVDASAWTPAKHRDNDTIHGGLIAANMIYIPLAMRFCCSISVGRKAAYRVITKWLGAKKGMIGANERNLQHIWERYQSVAHLWCASIMWDKFFPSSSDELIVFLSLSERIRCWAEQYYPKRSGSPLLNGLITWKVPPDFKLFEIEFDFNGVTMSDEWVKLATSPDVN